QVADIQSSIKVKNYKCFGDDPQGFEVIKPINIIVGRNNSGKSALIDLIQQACGAKLQFRAEDSPASKRAAAVFTATVDTERAQAVFRLGTSGGPIPGDHWEAA